MNLTNKKGLRYAGFWWGHSFAADLETFNFIMSLFLFYLMKT